MLRATALAALAAAAGAAAPRWHELSSEYTFEAFLADFGKTYASAEEHRFRELVFERNLRAILRHNADPASAWKKGVNSLSDRTEPERAALNGYNKAANAHPVLSAGRRSELPAVPARALADLPEAVDWRACSPFTTSELCPLKEQPAPSVVTSVKNQGQCGSCWAFSSTAVLESHFAIATGYLEDLATQQLVSCAPNTEQCGGTGGCAGSTGDLAYQYVADNGGIAGEFTYGYMSNYGESLDCDGARAASQLKSPLSGYSKPESNDAEALMTAVATVGPVVVNVDASVWHDYETGVFDECNYDKDVDINHAVTLVGYGPGYWLVRNSWGPEWGEGGYIKIQREDDLKCGTDSSPLDGIGCATQPVQNATVCGCTGILYEPVYPVVKV